MEADDGWEAKFIEVEPGSELKTIRSWNQVIDHHLDQRRCENLE
jgi:hypothetical protein